MRFLDTGATFRAFTLKALDDGVDLEDEAALVACIDAGRLEFTDDAVILDGRDVSAAIREPRVTAQVFQLADKPAVRARLLAIQRAFGQAWGALVCEGRDTGTVVFPNAPFKFFLDASIQERARRRHSELLARGREADLSELAAQIARRDERDRSRPVGALRAADDARRIDSSALSLEQVVEEMAAAVRGGQSTSDGAQSSAGEKGEEKKSPDGRAAPRHVSSCPSRPGA